MNRDMVVYDSIHEVIEDAQMLQLPYDTCTLL